MNRRHFMIGASAAGMGLAFPAKAGGSTPRFRAKGHQSIYVDAQGILNVGTVDPRALEEALMAAARERRIDIISRWIAPVGNVANAFEKAMASIGQQDKFIQDRPSYLMKVETVADIAKARDTGKIGIIFNFQDSVAFEANPANVAVFAALGVKIMQLTYNKRNLAGDGCLERSNAGLSDYGRELVSKIEEAHVLLDLSHSGQRTVAEAVAASTIPCSITHSGCRALTDHPRNTYDAEMRALADKGGVFGVFLMPFLRAKGQPGTEDLLRHLDHAVNICGEDHVGIGTDNPLIGYVINDEARAQQRQFYENRVKAGIAAPGEAPDVFNLVDGYNDAQRYDRLAVDLRSRGWSAARIDKVLGDNFVRLFREVWRG